MKTLAIIGAGHLGQQIAHYAISDKHFTNIVFFDDVTDHKTILDYPVLGGIDKVLSAYQNNLFTQLIIGIGYKHLLVRQKLYNQFINHIPFATIIHSSAWVDASATVENGSVIYPSCSLDANVHILANTILNIGCTIAHDSTVGPHSFLSPRVAVAGFTKIEAACIVGINATIIDNITIANNFQIGGGTVVIKSLQNAGLYVGNPAKFVR